jgi:hypothetical protein
VSPVRYEMGFYIPENGILRMQRRDTSSLISNVCIFFGLSFSAQLRRVS